MSLYRWTLSASPVHSQGMDIATVIPRPPRLALVGDRSNQVQAHTRLPAIVDALNRGPDDPIEVYWLGSASIDGPVDLAGFDGIWALPGSPYEHPAGMLAAIEAARTTGTPFLGTCGGFQYLLLEFARHICGLAQVAHGEEQPDAAEKLIVPLACSLLGEEAEIVVQPGTLAARAMGEGTTTERFFCRFGLNGAFRAALEAGGLVFSAHDALGDPRVVELPGHPFYVGSLFQPELSSGQGWVHPLISSFAQAARRHATSTGPGPRRLFQGVGH